MVWKDFEKETHLTPVSKPTVNIPSYCIQGFYQQRLQPNKYWHSARFNANQHDPYQLASLLKRTNYSFLDIGCDNGALLIKYFMGYRICGMDIKPSLEWLKMHFPKYRWEELSKAGFDIIKKEPWSVVICSGVMENVPRPDILRDSIAEIDSEWVIFATANRDMLSVFLKYASFNPPNNGITLREWAWGEFEGFIEEKFNIIGHFHGSFNSQIIVCKRRQK